MNRSGPFSRLSSAAPVGVGLVLAAGAAAALANFVPPYVAALFGLASGGAGLSGSLVLQRRTTRRELLEAWEAVASKRPSSDAAQPSDAADAGMLVLLNPDKQVVRFNQQRVLDLYPLTRWDDRAPEAGIVSNPGSVWLVEAPAGGGKTRFLLEACTELEAVGWACGWVRPSCGGSVVAVATGWRRPVLLIVDDADTRPDLVDLLRDVGRRHDDKIHVALAAREFGQWWADTLARLDTDLVHELGRPGRTKLEALTENDQDRQQLFAQAVRTFARYRGATLAAVRLTASGPLELLAVHAAALVAVEQQVIGDIDVDDALNRLFDVEEAWWVRRAAEHVGVGQLGIAQLRSAVVLAVLCGASSLGSARELLRHVPGLGKADDDLLNSVAHWIRDIYPQRIGNWLDPHLPAALVERYAAVQILMWPALAQAAVAAMAPRPHRGLTVLAKGMRHSRSAEMTAFVELVRQDPVTLLGPAIEVALRTPRLMDQALAEAVKHATRLTEADLTRLLAIDADGDALPRTGLALASRLLTLAHTPESRAARLIEVGRLRLRLEQYTPALVAYRQAIDVLSGLVDSGSVLRLPLLARAHGHLGGAYSIVASFEKALDAHERAAEIWHRLVAVAPRRYAADAAQALDDMSMVLGSLGRNDEALTLSTETVALWRVVAENDPDAHDVHLADALEHLSVQLSVQRDNDAALAACQEAIVIRCRLATIRPAEYGWGLACSLTFLARALGVVERHTEALAAAEDAADMIRRHVDLDPNTRRGHLAMCLDQLAQHRSTAGRHADALATAQESIAMLRALAAEQPERWTPMLAGAFDNMGNYLQPLGLHDEAIKATEKAIEMFRILSEQRPDAMQRHLDIAMRNLRRRQLAARRAGA